MIGNVQILKNNGESLVSNGLAHFKFNETNKQYIIYTLGEQVNELLKIYIGYLDAPVTDPGILDEDSTNITELLKKIGKNEDVSSIVTFLPLSAGLYHIHDKVKKVALQTSAFNNIINAQQRGQIQTLDKDEPIMKENTFFDPSLMEEKKAEENVVQEQSIFEKPMQPQIATTNDQIASTEEETKAPQQESVFEAPQEQSIEAKAEATESSSVVNANYQNLEAATDTIVSEDNSRISDEQAKEAIQAVETAQATIRDNIGLIKEYIKQQKNKEMSNNIEKKEMAIETPKEEVSEIPAITSQVESLPSQYDVVNNLELAPQPEVAENVLGSESNLGGDYLIDTSVNQISAGIDTTSGVDSKVAIPQVDLAQMAANPEPEQQMAGTSEYGVQQQNAVGIQTDLPQQTVVESVSQTPLNDQTNPASTSLSSEPQPEIIDTMSMIPKQGTSNAGASATGEGVIETTLDTANSSMVGDASSASEIQGTIADTSMQQPVNQGLPTMETPSSVEMTGGSVDQINSSTQDESETIDIQIPEIGIESQMEPASVTQGVQEVVSNIPVESVSNQASGPQQQGAPTQSAGGEFAIPQIDMSVSTIDQSQAPVVMPDGQSQDDNQGLVLTPEAFNKAA